MGCVPAGASAGPELPPAVAFDANILRLSIALCISFYPVPVSIAKLNTDAAPGSFKTLQKTVKNCIIL